MEEDKIVLNEILERHCITDDIYFIHPNIKNAMMEFGVILLERAAEKAIVTQEPVPAYEFVVSKQSILDTIKQVDQRNHTISIV